MDAILEILNRGVEQLLGRASGPLHFRLVVMPTVVTILAIRAGLRDAREGKSSFLWGMITEPAQRRSRLVAARKDITRIFIVAIVLDTAYQLMVLRAFYVVQALIVAVACAIVPYILFRGSTTLLARACRGNRPGRQTIHRLRRQPRIPRREPHNIFRRPGLGTTNRHHRRSGEAQEGVIECTRN